MRPSSHWIERLIFLKKYFQFPKTGFAPQGSWVWRETISALDRQADGKFGRALALDIPGCGEKRDRDTKDIPFGATNWQLTQLDKVPATYVLCLRDNILPTVWQEKFTGRFHADKIVQIDAGHQVMNTRPHALAEVLLREASGV